MRAGKSLSVSSADIRRAQSPGSRPQCAAEARLAGGDRAVDRRWRRHEWDYAANREVQDLCLALAGTFYRGGVRRTAPRQDASLAHQTAGRRGGRARRRADARGTARGNDPLDRRPDREGGGAQRKFRSTHLARPWSATAPDAPVQAVQRPALRRQIARCRRALCRSARTRHRPVGRRKEPDSGARSHPARTAAEEGSRRNPDA